MNLLLVTIPILLLLPVTIPVINIFRNGPRRWRGKSLSNILGVDPGKATLDDIKKLTRAEVMQLFYAAEAPKVSEINGEFQTEMHKSSLLDSAGDLYVHYLMGPGQWIGDAFSPLNQDTGHGYNLFAVRRNGSETIVRTLQMDTSYDRSTLDEKNSLHVSYRRSGKGLNRSMRDEIRRINDRLYLGLAFFSWTGGKINPYPFVVHGKPSPWVGADK